jgi:hypothetical protein
MLEMMSENIEQSGFFDGEAEQATGVAVRPLAVRMRPKHLGETSQMSLRCVIFYA